MSPLAIERICLGDVWYIGSVRNGVSAWFGFDGVFMIQSYTCKGKQPNGR
jgi:hypothetical protein